MFIRFRLVICSLIVFAAPFGEGLRAHDSWLITDSSMANEGDKAWLSFVTGEVFPYGTGATQIDRVEQFVDRVGPQTVSVTGFAPQDKGLSVRHKVEGRGIHIFGCALKPRLIEMQPEKFVEYLKMEDAAEVLGQYLRQQGASSASQVVVEEYTKFTKTMVDVSAAETDRGFLEPLGHRLEIVPLSNPCKWRAGETVQVKVLLDGHPWKDVPLCVGREGAVLEEKEPPAVEPAEEASPAAVKTATPAKPAKSNQKEEPARRSGPFSISGSGESEPKELPAVAPEKPPTIEPARKKSPEPSKSDEHHVYILRTRTDANGVASIKLDKAGHCFIKAHHIRPTGGLSKAKWESFWASLTFRVIGESNVNGELKTIRSFRGDLPPGAVIGHKMGLVALEHLGLSRGDDSLLVSHACPLRQEYASILDGIQTATGATVGRLNLRLEPVNSISQMHTVFVDRRTRRVLTIRCSETIVPMLEVDRLGEEEVAMRLATLREGELFDIESEEAILTRADTVDRLEESGRRHVEAPDVIRMAREEGKSKADLQTGLEGRSANISE